MKCGSENSKVVRITYNFTWLPNHVLLTVRTEKSPKNLFNQLRQGVPKKAILQCKTSSQSSVDAIVAGLQTAELLKLLILLEE